MGCRHKVGTESIRRDPSAMDCWMRRICVVLMSLTFSVSVKAQTFATDSISHERILVGPVDRSAFQDSSWYKENYSVYKAEPKLIRQIDSVAQEPASGNAGDSVLIVFGSWCSDSHTWVPMFLSITDSTMLAHKIQFIAVPRSNGWREQLTPGLNIEKVPTFIFYRDGKEIGRIVEEPQGDIGENILEILKGKYNKEVH